MNLLPLNCMLGTVYVLHERELNSLLMSRMSER